MMAGAMAIMLAVTVIDSHLGMRFDSNILIIRYTVYMERIKIVIFDESRQMNPTLAIMRIISLIINNFCCFQSLCIRLSASIIMANMA
jgi:hypothetical protein